MSDTSPTSLEQLELASSAPAVLDSAHIGDIHGAFGTIRQHDTGVRKDLAVQAGDLDGNPRPRTDCHGRRQ